MGTLTIGSGGEALVVENKEVVPVVGTTANQVDLLPLIKELEEKVAKDLNVIYSEFKGFQNNVVADLNTLASEIEKDRKTCEQINQDLNVQKICQIQGQEQYGQVLESIKKLEDVTTMLDCAKGNIQERLVDLEKVSENKPVVIKEVETQVVQSNLNKYWLIVLSILTIIALFK